MSGEVKNNSRMHKYEEEYRKKNTEIYSKQNIEIKRRRKTETRKT